MEWIDEKDVSLVEELQIFEVTSFLDCQDPHRNQAIVFEMFSVLWI